jgi:hypothetical protein
MRYSDLMEYRCPGCKFETNSWELMVVHAKRSHDLVLTDADRKGNA